MKGPKLLRYLQRWVFQKKRARATKGRYTILAKIFEKYLDGRPLDGPVPTLASG